jgi:putative salt-induced outer membrane protein YdiY
MKTGKLVCLLSLCIVGSSVAADRSWTNTTDLSLVSTSGNSETNNFSFGNKYTNKWSKLDLTLTAGAVRTKTTSKTPVNDGGVLKVLENSELTAESYNVGAKLRGKLLGEAFLWYANTGWDKNELAGLDSKLSFGAGFGYKIFQNDIHNLTSEFGFDYTSETFVDDTDNSFGSARLFLAYDRPLSETAKIESGLEYLYNLDDSEDTRINFNIGLSASLSSNLALKLGYKVTYDAQPFETVLSGTPDVIYVYDETDTIISTSLVINF